MNAAAPIRLLVVDDDPDLVVQVRLMLRRCASTYQVTMHTDPGTSLTDRLRVGDVDACLLDHFLGDRCGEDVLRDLPRDSGLPPIVVLTGASDPGLADTYLELGADDYLAKDEISPGLLDRTIRYAIQHRNSRRDLERSHLALLHSERLATIGRLAAGVAHEYNNLNAIILAGIERLARRSNQDPEQQQQLQRIIDSLERSRRISQGLLLIGRSAPTIHEPIDLVQQVQDTMALMERQIREGGIVLDVTVPDHPVPVLFDANDLHQVLSNLVTNSCHALWRSTKPRLLVRLTVESGQVSLAVADNGLGISKEDLARILEPFFSRKGAYDAAGLYPSRIQGSGLGLAVCATLMEQAGGSISIESELGLGTTVYIQLPLAAVPLPEPVPVTADDSTLSGGLVAVVDDNIELLELMREALSEAGFTVSAFGHSIAFLNEAAERTWDLILLDWQMPQCSGEAVLVRLSDAARQPPLRVIVLSGAAPNLPEPLPPGLRIVTVLAKPLRLDRLIEVVRQALARG